MSFDDQTSIADYPPQQFVEIVTSGENLVEMLDKATRTNIERDAIQFYQSDKESMQDWLQASRKAIDLAKLVKKDKTYPFDRASNIKYPLLASAALQFNARAYPAIVPARDVVKARTWGDDPQGLKAARGERVASYMSYQLLAEVPAWDESTDALLLQLPIVNDLFRKVWLDDGAQSKVLEPGKLVFNNSASSFEECPRKTEELAYYPYQIEQKFRSGAFVEFEWTEEDDDQAQQDFIEQHTLIDLDEDGYPEPYIATVHVQTETLVALYADFQPEDVQFITEDVPVTVNVPGEFGVVPVRQMQSVPAGISKIRARTYYVHYQFVPSMENKVLGEGLGHLLGDISEAINSSFNMLIDAGHYASLGGGFIGSEFRIKGGAQRLRPGEWRKTEATGMDVKSSLAEITYPGPDQTMFAMLGMLIDAGKEVASVKDVLTGETTTNMQPTTVMALIEQGLKVFTAAYKRIYRSLSKEFRLFADINARALPAERYNAFLDMGEPFDPREDFSAVGMDVQPVADPQSVTKMQEMAKAQLVMDMASNGLASPGPAAQRIFEAAGIEDTEELIPQPDPMQQEMQEMQFRAAQLDLADKEANVHLTLAKIDEALSKAAKNMSDAEVSEDNLKLKAMSEALKSMIDERKTPGRMEREPSNA